jgi:hypothetical protein
VTIDRSTTVAKLRVDPGKTLLVGVNEAGKTALLQALQQIEPPDGAEKFNALRDYPRSRYTEIQRGIKVPGKVIVAEAAFTLTETERRLVLEESPSSADVTELVIFRYLDNSLRWNFGSAKVNASFGDVEKDLLRPRAYLAKQDDNVSVLAVLDKLTASCKPSTPVTGEFAKSLLAWLETVFPLIDESDQNEEKRYDRIKAAVALHGQTSTAGAAVRKHLPLFVYYSTYFTVRPRINFMSLAARERIGDIDTEYDFGNLCLLRLLGLTAQELSDLGGASRTPTSTVVSPAMLTRPPLRAIRKGSMIGSTGLTLPAWTSRSRFERFGVTRTSSFDWCLTGSTSRSWSSTASAWRLNLTSVARASAGSSPFLSCSRLKHKAN